MKDKDYCLIMMIDGSGRIIELRVVPNDDPIKYYVDTSDANRDRYINDTIMKLGFRDKDDYSATYPGNKKINKSIIMCRLNDCLGSCHAAVEPVNLTMWYRSKNCLSQISDDLVIRYKRDGTHCYDNNNVSIISSPTINEIKLIDGLKTISPKKLWFCSDWKDCVEDR